MTEASHDAERAHPDTPRQTSTAMRSPDSTLHSWLRSMAHREPAPGGRLPSHSPNCAGCGQENPASLALEVDATGTGVSAVHRFDHRQEGAPGIAHGGLVATAFDDLFGFLLYRVGELAVTRTLTVDYLRPVLLGVDYRFAAAVSERAGRRLHVEASADEVEGPRVATAHATFVIVDVEHFTRGSASPPQ